MSCSQGIVCSNQNIDLFQPAVMFGVILCIGKKLITLKDYTKSFTRNHYYPLLDFMGGYAS